VRNECQPTALCIYAHVSAAVLRDFVEVRNLQIALRNLAMLCPCLGLRSGLGKEFAKRANCAAPEIARNKHTNGREHALGLSVGWTVFGMVKHSRY